MRVPAMLLVLIGAFVLLAAAAVPGGVGGIGGLGGGGTGSGAGGVGGVGGLNGLQIVNFNPDLLLQIANQTCSVCGDFQNLHDAFLFASVDEPHKVIQLTLVYRHRGPVTYTMPRECFGQTCTPGPGGQMTCIPLCTGGLEITVAGDNASENLETREPVKNAPIVVFINDSGLIRLYRTYTDENGIALFHFDQFANRCIDYQFAYCHAPTACGFDECLRGLGVSPEMQQAQRIDHVRDIPMAPDESDPGTGLVQDPLDVKPVSTTTNYCPPPPPIGGIGAPAFCFPLALIFALLAGSMYLSGRNPFSGFDFSAPRLHKPYQYSARGRTASVSMTALAMGTSTAASGSRGAVEAPKGSGIRGALGAAERAVRGARGGSAEMVMGAGGQMLPVVRPGTQKAQAQGLRAGGAPLPRTRAVGGLPFLRRGEKQVTTLPSLGRAPDTKGMTNIQAAKAGYGANLAAIAKMLPVAVPFLGRSMGEEGKGAPMSAKTGLALADLMKYSSLGVFFTAFNSIVLQDRGDVLESMRKGGTRLFVLSVDKALAVREEASGNQEMKTGGGIYRTSFDFDKNTWVVEKKETQVMDGRRIEKWVWVNPANAPVEIKNALEGYRVQTKEGAFVVVFNSGTGKYTAVSEKDGTVYVYRPEKGNGQKDILALPPEIEKAINQSNKRVGEAAYVIGAYGKDALAEQHTRAQRSVELLKHAEDDADAKTKDLKRSVSDLGMLDGFADRKTALGKLAEERTGKDASKSRIVQFSAGADGLNRDSATGADAGIQAAWATLRGEGLKGLSPEAKRQQQLSALNVIMAYGTEAGALAQVLQTDKGTQRAMATLMDVPLFLKKMEMAGPLRNDGQILQEQLRSKLGQQISTFQEKVKSQIVAVERVGDQTLVAAREMERYQELQHTVQMANVLAVNMAMAREKITDKKGLDKADIERSEDGMKTLGEITAMHAGADALLTLDPKAMAEKGKGNSETLAMLKAYIERNTNPKLEPVSFAQFVGMKKLDGQFAQGLQALSMGHEMAAFNVEWANARINTYNLGQDNLVLLIDKRAVAGMGGEVPVTTPDGKITGMEKAYATIPMVSDKTVGEMLKGMSPAQKEAWAALLRKPEQIPGVPLATMLPARQEMQMASQMLSLMEGGRVVEMKEGVTHTIQIAKPQDPAMAKEITGFLRDYLNIPPAERERRTGAYTPVLEAAMGIMRAVGTAPVPLYIAQPALVELRRDLKALQEVRGTDAVGEKRGQIIGQVTMNAQVVSLFGNAHDPEMLKQIESFVRTFRSASAQERAKGQEDYKWFAKAATTALAAQQEQGAVVDTADAAKALAEIGKNLKTYQTEKDKTERELALRGAIVTADDLQRKARLETLEQRGITKTEYVAELLRLTLKYEKNRDNQQAREGVERELEQHGALMGRSLQAEFASERKEERRVVEAQATMLATKLGAHLKDLVDGKVSSVSELVELAKRKDEEEGRTPAAGSGLPTETEEAARLAPWRKMVAAETGERETARGGRLPEKSTATTAGTPEAQTPGTKTPAPEKPLEAMKRIPGIEPGSGEPAPASREELAALAERALKGAGVRPEAREPARAAADATTPTMRAVHTPSVVEAREVAQTASGTVRGFDIILQAAAKEGKSGQYQKLMGDYAQHMADAIANSKEIEPLTRFAREQGVDLKGKTGDAVKTFSPTLERANDVARQGTTLGSRFQEALQAYAVHTNKALEAGGTQRPVTDFLKPLAAEMKGAGNRGAEATAAVEGTARGFQVILDAAKKQGREGEYQTLMGDYARQMADVVRAKQDVKPLKEFAAERGMKMDDKVASAAATFSRSFALATEVGQKDPVFRERFPQALDAYADHSNRVRDIKEGGRPMAEFVKPVETAARERKANETIPVVQGMASGFRTVIDAAEKQGRREEMQNLMATYALHLADAMTRGQEVKPLPAFAESKGMKLTGGVATAAKTYSNSYFERIGGMAKKDPEIGSGLQEALRAYADQSVRTHKAGETRMKAVSEFLKPVETLARAAAGEEGKAGREQVTKAGGGTPSGADAARKAEEEDRFRKETLDWIRGGAEPAADKERTIRTTRAPQTGGEGGPGTPSEPPGIPKRKRESGTAGETGVGSEAARPVEKPTAESDQRRRQEERERLEQQRSRMTEEQKRQREQAERQRTELEEAMRKMAEAKKKKREKGEEKG